MITLYVFLRYFYPDPQRWVFIWSLISGYLASLLLAVTLSLGTWNVLRGRSNPVSSDLRRDVGIWCGIFSLLHVAFGLNVHMKNWILYFVTDAGGLRTDLFGFANYLGVAATLLVFVLLGTSNDFSFKRFGRERWKRIQRWNYFFAFLVMLHGFIFITVEKRVVPYVFVLGMVAIWMSAVQFLGFRKNRRRLQLSTNSQN